MYLYVAHQPTISLFLDEGKRYCQSARPHVGTNQIFISKRVVLYGRCHLWLTCHNRWEFGRVVNQLMGMSQHGSGDIGDWSNGNIIRFHHWYCPHPYCWGTWWRHQIETFPRCWPFVRGIHRSLVNSPHKAQWRGALMFLLICVRINGWVKNREAGDLRRHRIHYDVSVMIQHIDAWTKWPAVCTRPFEIHFLQWKYQ